MATAAEAAAAKSQLAGDLAAGVVTLSLNQEITFTKYVKLVLPLDGFVFWVRADLLSASALFNAGRFNSAGLNQPVSRISTAPTLKAMGSLHYSTNSLQNEDESIAVNQVVFTSLSAVQDFNEIGTSVIFIARIGVDGPQYAFTQRRPFYQQADLYHYVGDAVYPAMQTQIIDKIDGFDSQNVVVSNSLPIWLALNSYAPAWATFTNETPLYPSFAVPGNIAPPYGAVHIPPEGTKPIQAVPSLGRTMTHDQLVHDTVKITLYGLRNYNALSFIDCVNQYSLDTDFIGIMNMPVVRDEKRMQSELNVLAMKKTIEFEVSYYQSTARDVARQQILEAVPSFTII